MLNEFYAVTSTSVYHVRAGGENGYPSAVKIALKDKSAVGLGEKLKNGTMLAICHQLQMYFPEKYGMAHPLTGYERKIEHINTGYWGGHSSDIIALFKKKREAMVCFNSAEQKPRDPRWIEETEQVLQEIGDEHPSFYISHDPYLALLPTNKVV